MKQFLILLAFLCAGSFSFARGGSDFLTTENSILLASEAVDCHIGPFVQPDLTIVVYIGNVGDPETWNLDLEEDGQACLTIRVYVYGQWVELFNC
ncbi:MAG: hypothetical protein SFV52_07925 [Saprospiraceae bacterium]|nr:hypothetical protein [Saprospiraceae bacterium]